MLLAVLSPWELRLAARSPRWALPARVTTALTARPPLAVSPRPLLAVSTELPLPACRHLLLAASTARLLSLPLLWEPRAPLLAQTALTPWALLAPTALVLWALPARTVPRARLAQTLLRARRKLATLAVLSSKEPALLPLARSPLRPRPAERPTTARRLPTLTSPGVRILLLARVRALAASLARCQLLVRSREVADSAVRVP